MITDQVTWLTIREVASRLRLSRMTVYRMVHAGDLSAHRFGRSFRIAEAELDAYLAQTRNGVPSA